MTEREDWCEFRTLPGVSKRSGVAVEMLPRLVAKELADNAMDAMDKGTECSLDLRDGTLIVEDDGEGIPGDDEAIARLYSIGRPLVSTKLLREPKRGVQGHGNRVVAAAVQACGGSLRVATRSRILTLAPQDDGSTRIVKRARWRGRGTRVEVTFAGVLREALDDDDDVLSWAERSIALGSPSYRGSSSPWWYDSDSFHELLVAHRDATVRRVVEQLDGCSGRAASEVAGSLTGRNAADVSRGEAEALLSRARQQARPVRPKRLGRVGRLPGLPDAWAHAEGTFRVEAGRGSLHAEIPYVVEAWAERADGDEHSLELTINRTPTVASLWIQRKQAHEAIFGGVFPDALTGRRVRIGRRALRIVVNVTAPHVPIVSESKTPDLTKMAGSLIEAIEGAARRARRRSASPIGGAPRSQKAIVLAHLDEAIERVSGGVLCLPYSLRQLFYALRPRLLEQAGKEPDYGTFAGIIAAREKEIGSDLPGIYRDDRGTLYMPHSGERIPLGTISVAEFQRPAYKFHRVLYIEKEGLFPALIAARWPERWDCALVTSKGFASRAAKDLLDLLGDGNEPVTFYALHDSDGEGTMIYQSLTEATLARPARRVHVVNLGLEPAEARAMGLAVERVERKGGRRVPVADYVPAEDREWLQSHRIELNAMTTPQLLKFLDGRMAEQVGPAKLVPPPAVIEATLRETVAARVAVEVRERILREHGAEAQAAARVRELEPALCRAVSSAEAHVRAELERERAQPWTAPLDTLAAEVTRETA